MIIAAVLRGYSGRICGGFKFWGRNLFRRNITEGNWSGDWSGETLVHMLDVKETDSVEIRDHC